MPRKIVKWIGIVIGGLLLLVIIAGAALYAIGTSKFNKIHNIKAESIVVPMDSAAVVRGKHIAITLLCADCHNSNLGGKLFIEESQMGTVYAPNLTTGKGGIGDKYIDADWVRAIRHGIRKDGRAIMIMPANFYNNLNEQDLGDLIAYLKQLPAVDNVLPDREVGPLARVISVFDDGLLPANVIDHTTSIAAAVEPGVTVAYGEYKAGVCRACHGENLAGGLVHGPPGTPPSANITPDPEYGIGAWSEADFFTALRNGKRPNGEKISDAMPGSFGKMTDDELRAIWLYLQSVRPVRTELAKK